MKFFSIVRININPIIAEKKAPMITKIGNNHGDDAKNRHHNKLGAQFLNKSYEKSLPPIELFYGLPSTPP